MKSDIFVGKQIYNLVFFLNAQIEGITTTLIFCLF